MKKKGEKERRREDTGKYAIRNNTGIREESRINIQNNKNGEKNEGERERKKKKTRRERMKERERQGRETAYTSHPLPECKNFGNLPLSLSHFPPSLQQLPECKPIKKIIIISSN